MHGYSTTASTLARSGPEPCTLRAEARRDDDAASSSSLAGRTAVATVIAERTPEAVLDFWLGPMRTIDATTEDNWRNGMLKWRVGVFARGGEDAAFREAQREWCEQIHLEGVDHFFSDPIWDTPTGTLAKIIVLDQFGRCVYRGTPVAYANDVLTTPLLRHVIDRGWDMTEYNEVERMWIYVALSHPERRFMQEKSVEKWTSWSNDLIAASPRELRKTNQHVSWYFIKTIVEHAEAVLIFGRFPHRNPIMSRPHKAGEVYYLTDTMRPLWSFTQPPRPDYFAVLGALSRFDDDLDVEDVSSEAVAVLQSAANIEKGSPGCLMDVFDLPHLDRVTYDTLYRHLQLDNKRAGYDAVCSLSTVADLNEQVSGVILKDPGDTWPPKSAKHSVPAVIDVPAMNEIVRCKNFATGNLTVTMQAVNRLVVDTGLSPMSPEGLLRRFETLRSEEPRLFRLGEDGTPYSAPLGKKGFTQLCGVLFSRAGNLEKVAARMYDVIDIDYDHSITTAEALMGLTLFCPGDGAVRSDLLFDIFDVNNDERLDRDELYQMLRTVGLRGIHMIENLFDPYLAADDRGMAVTFEAVRHYDEIENDARLIQSRDDAGENGPLTREAFVAWAADHPMMQQYIDKPNLLFGALM